MTNIDKVGQFPFRHVFTPRWRDNDQYGHINNVVYYEYFDTTANLFLIENAGLDPQKSAEIAYVVFSQCQYFAPLSYPDRIEVGLAVKKLGDSSVTWLLGIFNQNDEQVKAIGEFVHVFVDRNSGAKTNIPESTRSKLVDLQI